MSTKLEKLKEINDQIKNIINSLEVKIFINNVENDNDKLNSNFRLFI